MSSVPQRSTACRIVVAEDDPVDADRLRRLLGGAGFEVELCADGREALERIRLAPPDLVLSRISLAHLDGHQLCRALRAGEATRRIPFVLLTPRRTPIDIIRGLESGADNFLTKPFDESHLLERLARILDNAERRRQGEFEITVAIRVGGREVVLNADKQQMVELLFATAEELTAANDRLEQAMRLVEQHASTLEERVAERSRELAEAQERYRSLVENIPAVTYVEAIEEAGRLFYLSPQSEHLFGVPSLELLADPEAAQARIHPEDRTRVAAARARARASGHPLREEYRMRRADGRLLWVRDEAAAVRDAEGRLRYLQGVLIDVTEHKRAERRLRVRHAVSQALARTTRIAEAAPAILGSLGESLGWDVAALWQSQKDGLRCVEFWKRDPSRGGAFEAATRGVLMPRGQGLVWRVASEGRALFVPDVAVEAAFLRSAAAQRDGLHSGLAFPVRGADGVLGVIELFGHEVAAPDDDLREMMDDIGDQVGVFLERRRAEDERQRLGAIVESTEDAIVVLGRDGMIEAWNAGAERLYGYSQAEIVGRPITTLAPPELAEEASGLVAGVARGEPIRDLETVRLHKDGRRLDVSLAASAVRAASGEVLGICSISRDIGGRKRLEAQFQQAQKMEAVGRLAAGVAHDFNNLINVITGYGELMQRALAPDDPLGRKVREIVKAGERAAGLTRQLLAFSRQQPLQPRILDLNALLRDLEKMLRRLVGEDVEPVCRLAPGLGHVRADPGQLEQVVMNLAVNARDAMPSGGRLLLETSELELAEDEAKDDTLVPAGRYVRLTVRDTGVGMDAATRARLFEPFFTTKEAGKGTGLGLATVYGIVAQSDGHIRVESRPGEGSCFEILLPWREAPGEADAGAAYVPAASGSETILLVEDADSLRRLAKEVLAGYGYRVLEAARPSQALEIAASQGGGVDLLLTDVVMPEMSGRALAEKLAASCPRARLLYMSGYTDDVIGQHGILEPGIAFLQKPFTPVELAHKVRQVLDAG